MKLKGIGGGTHKRWIVSINWIISHKSYLLLTCSVSTGHAVYHLRMSAAQMVHGCRQFVPQGVGLILETNATLILCYYVIIDCPGNREEGVDDVKSSCLLPRRASEAIQWEVTIRSKAVRLSKSINLSLVQIVVWNSTT